MLSVILAAGCGSRLSSHNGQLPKLLLPVAGQAIIDHTLEAFSRVGVTEVAIVVGHEARTLREWVGDGARHGMRIQYVFNPDYRMGNALSVYAARSFTENEPFILSMADHMISTDLLESMLEDRTAANILAVDFAPSPRDVDEGTRVLVGEDGMVSRIGKGLTPWDGIDAGVFRLTPAIFEAIDVMQTRETEYQLSQAIRQMIKLGNPLQALDVSGCYWQDIDTLEDLHIARRVLTESA